MIKKKRWHPIKPSFIKNDKGKTVGVYVTIEKYKVIVNTLKEFEQVKQKLKKEMSGAKK